MRLLEPLISMDQSSAARTLVLTGTDVPVHDLVAWIKADQSLDEIVSHAPNLRRGHVVAVIEAIREAAHNLAVPSDDTAGALVVSWPDRIGGTPTFSRSRVPLDTFFDHVTGGDSLSVFLDDFPDIARDQVNAVLDASLALAVAAVPRNVAAAE